jgi:hypothetical protein
MRLIQNIALLLTATLLAGCVSAAIAQTGKQEIRFPRHRKQITEAYGEPILAGRAIPGLNTKGTVRWEIYEYNGMMRDEEFANASGTAGAVTLGISEVISLPSVALNRAQSASARHLFLAEYRSDGSIHPFRRISKHDLAGFQTRSKE